MAETGQLQTASTPRAGAEDFSGRGRMTWNVLSSWGGQMVYVIAGFVLPRFIDNHLGQAALGIWDFGWSIVSYFGLTQIGICSAVDPQVARYRAAGDTLSLNRVASSVGLVQVLSALVAAIATAVVIFFVPQLLSKGQENFVGDARFVVLCLGASLVLQIAFGMYTGVMQGCHRFDWHNAINGGSHALTVTGLIVALVSGGGLRALAAVQLAGTLAAELMRMIVTHRVCPELRLGWAFVRWDVIKHSFRFGGLIFAGAMAGRLWYQTNSLVVFTFLGPAALALYSRPMGLTRHLMTFIHKLSFPLTPIASHLDAEGKRDELSQLVLRASRYSACLALPPVLYLAIVGGPVLRLWMGKDYQDDLLLALLALGQLMTIAHRPLFSVVIGMGAHKRPVYASLAIALLSVVLCFLALGPLHMGILGAAVSMIAPMTLLDGLLVPALACTTLQVPLLRFFRKTWRDALLYNLPFAAALALSRWLLPPMTALAVGTIAGGLIVTPLYWAHVLPASMKTKVRRALGRFGWRAGAPGVSPELRGVAQASTPGVRT